jgi:hypothetical protein
MNSRLVATSLEENVHAGLSFIGQVDFEHLLGTEGVEGSVSLIEHTTFLIEFLSTDPVSTFL